MEKLQKLASQLRVLDELQQRVREMEELLTSCKLATFGVSDEDQWGLCWQEFGKKKERRIVFSCPDVNATPLIDTAAYIRLRITPLLQRFEAMAEELAQGVLDRMGVAD